MFSCSTGMSFSGLNNLHHKNFRRVYDFLYSIKNEYAGKRILIVAHGGISIPIKCYFDGIPTAETLLPLCLENCETAKYSYKELDLER